MLRFHKFTIGWNWIADYGSSDNPVEFEYLSKYSPLQNLKDGTAYPATMVTTADHDDRVVPAHSFKFAARLQEYHNGTNPVLIRIDTNAGHGAGKPTSKLIEEAVVDQLHPRQFGEAFGHRRPIVGMDERAERFARHSVSREAQGAFPRDIDPLEGAITSHDAQHIRAQPEEVFEVGICAASFHPWEWTDRVRFMV